MVFGRRWLIGGDIWFTSVSHSTRPTQQKIQLQTRIDHNVREINVDEYFKAGPETTSHFVADHEPPRRFRVRDYIVPTLIGGAIGTVFLAPFCRCVGDPNGHSIGFGVGGLAGLFIGIVVHTLMITFPRDR